MAGQETTTPMHCTCLVEDLTSLLEKDISVDCHWRESNTAQKHRPCQQVSHVLHTASLGVWNISQYLLMYLLFLVIMSKAMLASTEKKIPLYDFLNCSPDGAATLFTGKMSKIFNIKH